MLFAVFSYFKAVKILSPTSLLNGVASMATILLFAACSNSVMESSLNEMASDSLTAVSVVPDSLRSGMLRVSPAGATVL